MESVKPPSVCPHIRGTSLRGAKEAVLELWGQEGLREILARVPADAATTLRTVVMPSVWVPEAQFMAVCRAVWDGPAAADADAFHGYMERFSFHAFGRFQRLLLGMATPSDLATRTPALWRREHSHGTLAVEVLERGQIIRLTESAYAETSFMRGVAAEAFRCVMDLTRVKVATSHHELERPGTLAVHQTWR